jgi:hypothetical protein
VWGLQILLAVAVPLSAVAGESDCGGSTEAPTSRPSSTGQVNEGILCDLGAEDPIEPQGEIDAEAPVSGGPHQTSGSSAATGHPSRWAGLRLANREAATPQPGDGYIVRFAQQLPTAVAVIPILLLGIAAVALILAISRKPPSP